MTKIIQPISDPDDIRKEAEETVKEQYADFYINQPAPDPLTWHAPTEAKPTPQEEVAKLSDQNDPLKEK